MAAQQFLIMDRKTGAQVGKPYTSRSRANNRVNRLDNEYGAYRYFVKAAEVST